MKKIYFAILAFALAVCFSSCKNNPSAQEQVKEASLPEIIEKAKAEGANWSVDEWKAVVKDVMVALKPMLMKIGEMSEKIKDDPQKAAAFLSELESMQKEFEPMEKLMNEFDSIASKCENGKKVMEDEAFEKELKKELGIPDDF